MSEKTAKLFHYGRSQAVRLPRAFRFEGGEVYIRRDEETGEVILSVAPNSWDGFFALRETTGDEVRDFLVDRTDPPAEGRGLFGRAGARRKGAR